MPVPMPKLPWPADALEPAISAETISFHYGRHHKGYVDTVNRLIKGTAFASASLAEIVQGSSGPLANAAAQAWNHEFYWNCLSPKRTKPRARLVKAIEQAFGSFADFEKRFKGEALSLFGSGWTWLVRTRDGQLEIVSTPNAGLRVHEEAMHPLLVCDVWEHAYYVDYRNERARYVEAFWNHVDWNFVAAQAAALPVVNIRAARSSARTSWTASKASKAGKAASASTSKSRRWQSAVKASAPKRVSRKK